MKKEDYEPYGKPGIFQSLGEALLWLFLSILVMVIILLGIGLVDAYGQQIDNFFK